MGRIPIGGHKLVHMSLTRPSRTDIVALAQEMTRQVSCEIPAYAQRASTDLYTDVVDTNIVNADLYFRVLSESRTPLTGELEQLEASARRRVHQGVVLEDVLHAYRVGAQVMWQRTLELVAGEDVAALASLTLKYVDCVSTAAERAYQEEREDAVRSREHLVHLFLVRLFEGEFADDADVIAEASALGYDLAQMHTVVAIGPMSSVETQLRRAGIELAWLAGELRRIYPATLSSLLASELVVAVPTPAAHDICATLESALTPRGNSPRLSAGLGMPRAGRGLRHGYEEARRARALGELIDPDRTVHTYADTRFFDLFRRGESIDAFVEEVLGRLIEYDHKHQRHCVETLIAYFAEGMNRKAAARRLGVHPNTLDYRLRRVEELLGAPMSGEFSFRFQLASKLLPLTSHPRKWVHSAAADGA